MNNVKKYENFYYQKARDGGTWNEGLRKDLIHFISQHIVSGDTILEVGCGEGDLINYLPKDAIYTGADISSFAIKQAQKVQNKKNSDFILLEKDSDTLPFPDNFFKFIVSVYALEHFKNPKKTLDEMARVLKKEGKLLIIAPNLELPISLPNAIRHKSIVFKIWFIILRIKDYFYRCFGILSFRMIKENFTEATGKYEKSDDDLTYVVSSFEVISYLQKHHQLEGILKNKIKKEDGWKYVVRKIITFFPTMQYYGDMLFIIMRKSNNNTKK